MNQRIRLRFLIVTFVLLLISTSSLTNAQTKAPALVTKQTPRLVDVGARSCIPCKMMAPILDELRQEYAGVLTVDFFDVRENPDAAQEYKIRGIPTQIFYDGSGKERTRHLGFMSKEDILNTFQKMGVTLKKPDVGKK